MELYFNTWVEAANYFNSSSSSIQNSFRKSGCYKGFIIDKLTSQAKKIKVFIEDKEIVFDSYNKCDKYFNM